MDKQKIIEDIAKNYQIIIDEKDPILAVFSINESLFDDFENRLNKLLLQHKTDLESYKHNSSIELQSYSNQIIAELETVLKKINTNTLTPKNETTPDDEKTAKKYDNNLIYISLASQIIFLLIGILIGLFI